MRIGLSFPTTELRDPAAVREFAQGAEQLGFTHMTALEHVLGTRHGPRGENHVYTPENPIHEPLVLFGYLAGLTETIELVTSVLVVPQRQAVLVARQAAEVDVLSGGRLRLGIGVGSNVVEFGGLSADFHDRGARVEEQVDLMRALWTQEEVTYHGRWHDIERSGITILPVQRPIPLWMGGGHTDRVLRRIGRMADGWMASGPAGAEEQLATIHEAADAAGRDPADVGIQGRMSLAAGGPEQWLEAARRWQDLGATHLAVNTRGSGFTEPAQYLKLGERFLSEVAPELAD